MFKLGVNGQKKMDHKDLVKVWFTKFFYKNNVLYTKHVVIYYHYFCYLHKHLVITTVYNAIKLKYNDIKKMKNHLI